MSGLHSVASFLPSLLGCSPRGCADYHTAQGTRIKMKWSTGVEAHDWQAVAKKDNLNVIQVGRWPNAARVACITGCTRAVMAAAQSLQRRQLQSVPARVYTLTKASHPGAFLSHDPSRTLLLPTAQVEMRRLEQVVQTIHLELQNIRRKEERMRDINGEPSRPTSHLWAQLLWQGAGKGTSARWGQMHAAFASIDNSPSPLGGPLPCSSASSPPARPFLMQRPFTAVSFRFVCRSATESTNNRVAWFNVIVALICIALAAWQLWYLNKVWG